MLDPPYTIQVLILVLVFRAILSVEISYVCFDFAL